MAKQMGQKPNKLVSNATSSAAYLAPPAGVGFDFIEVWDRVVRDFPAGHFRESERDVLRLYCDVVVQQIAVSTQLRAEGHVVETVRGSAPNPLVSVQTQLAGVINACVRQLRIAPMQRLDNRQVPKTPAIAPAPEDGGGTRPKIRLAGVA